MARKRATFDLRAGEPIGGWRGEDLRVVDKPEEFGRALADLREPLLLVEGREGLAWARGGEARIGRRRQEDLPLLAHVPACAPAVLGDPGFRADHRLAFAYVAGAMANGIASEELVEAMGRAGMLGMFGAAGLTPERVELALERISTRLGDRAWGTNLIHSPYEPDLESALVSLYLRRGVQTVSASAYLALTLPLVRYRVYGIHRDASGAVVVPNRVIAKVSRIEVAEKFFSPPPEEMLRALVSAGDITPQQAVLASEVPMAQDLTAEADSGGHTDNRPALALLPTMLALRDRKQSLYGDAFPLRVGAGGGIGTPQAAAAAFEMGAAYIVTGSVNQACLESGTSAAVRTMLAGAEQADVTMAPAADMFEMGIELQVLKRGTMFPMRAHKLRALYREHGSLEAIPGDERSKLERQVFRMPLDEVWEQTRRFWQQRDPKQVSRAESDARHKMALVFRWYLGMSSRWANTGEAGREIDYQVWCGPAMGAFNEWTRGSFLEQVEHRRVVLVARNLLHGAAVTSRARSLARQGVRFNSHAVSIRPRRFAQLEPYFDEVVGGTRDVPRLELVADAGRAS